MGICTQYKGHSGYMYVMYIFLTGTRKDMNMLGSDAVYRR